MAATSSSCDLRTRRWWRAAWWPMTTASWRRCSAGRHPTCRQTCAGPPSMPTIWSPSRSDFGVLPVAERPYPRRNRSQHRLDLLGAMVGVLHHVVLGGTECDAVCLRRRLETLTHGRVG